MVIMETFEISFQFVFDDAFNMPKETQNQFVSRMVREYPKVFRNDNNVLFCIVCDSRAPASKLSSVKEHFISVKHKRSIQKKSKLDSSLVQTFVSNIKNQSSSEINPFHMVRSVVDSFDSEEALSIEQAQEIFASKKIKSELAFVNSNFAVISRSITKLETKGLELYESIQLNKIIEAKINVLKEKKYAEKMKRLHERNVGYQTLKEIRNILYECKSSENEYIQKLTANEISMFKYAPTTSMDVERVFSAYKMIFTDRRRRFTFENLKKHVILNCNCLLEDEEN